MHTSFFCLNISPFFRERDEIISTSSSRSSGYLQPVNHPEVSHHSFAFSVKGKRELMSTDVIGINGPESCLAEHFHAQTSSSLPEAPSTFHTLPSSRMVDSIHEEQLDGQQNNYEQLQLEDTRNACLKSDEYSTIINQEIFQLDSCIADHFNGQESSSDNNSSLHGLPESTRHPQQYETLASRHQSVMNNCKFLKDS